MANFAPAWVTKKDSNGHLEVDVDDVVLSQTPRLADVDEVNVKVGDDVLTRRDAEAVGDVHHPVDVPDGSVIRSKDDDTNLAFSSSSDALTNEPKCFPINIYPNLIF